MKTIKIMLDVQYDETKTNINTMELTLEEMFDEIQNDTSSAKVICIAGRSVCCEAPLQVKGTQSFCTNCNKEV